VKLHSTKRFNSL